MTSVKAALLAAVILAPSAALAGPQCTTEPKDKWMSEEAMRARIAEMGYKDIKTFKVSGPCYEIYGRTADGKKAEVYFNPVTGEVTKANIS